MPRTNDERTHAKQERARGDLGAVSSAITELTPYCDAISAYLLGVVENNGRAAVETIELLGEIDVLVAGICDLVPGVAEAVGDLQAALVGQCLLPGQDEAAADGQCEVTADGQGHDVSCRHAAALVEAVQKVAVRTDDLVVRTDLNARRLARCSSAAVAEMQFEDIARQVVDHVAKALDDLRDQLGQLGENLRGEADLEAVLASVRSVEELRRAHEADLRRLAHALGGSEPAPAEESPIELF